MDSEPSHIIRTGFKEFRGVYEKHKSEAFAKHLRTVAEEASISQRVRICALAPERPWVGLQEWVNNSGTREGQWVSDIDFEIFS